MKFGQYVHFSINFQYLLFFFDFGHFPPRDVKIQIFSKFVKFFQFFQFLTSTKWDKFAFFENKIFVEDSYSIYLQNRGIVILLAILDLKL